MNCRLCQSDNLNIIKWGSTNLIHCTDCDIYYLADFPNKEKLNDYYEKEYKIKSDVGYTEFRRMSRMNEQYELLKYINQYKQIRSILDVGCDKGYFLDEARRMGIEVAGVELSENARQYCKMIGLDVRRSIDEFNNNYHAVIMNHSLEHFTDPKKIIIDIKSRLTHNGLLIVRVPAFDSFWSNLMRQYWIWFQPQNHYFHFSIKSLRNLVESLGFYVLSIKYRKPNNKITRKLTSIARTSLSKNTNYHPTIRNRIGYLVESIVGIEIILVAEKK